MKNLTIFSIFIFFMAVLFSVASHAQVPVLTQTDVGGLIQTIALTDSISAELEASDSAYILKNEVLQARARLEKLRGQLEPLSKRAYYQAIKELAQAQCTLYTYLAKEDPSNYAYTYTAKKFDDDVTAFADKLKRIPQ
jgi:hypothetical protein